MSSQVQPAVPDMVESTVRTVGALAPSHRRIGRLALMTFKKNSLLQ